MAYNDLVLLDSIIKKRKDAFGSARDESEVFELFSFEQLLKDFDLSYEELEDGWVDGGDDGGIDGFFVLLNGRLLNNSSLDDYSPKSPIFDIVVITTKYGETFKQAPLNTLCSSLPQLFDLRKDKPEIKFPLEQTILDIRETFRHAYINLASNRPILNIKIFYTCRGDTAKIAPNVHRSSALLNESVRQMFSDSAVDVHFVGASELLELARRKQTYSLSLRFIESTISRERTNYVLLSRLVDYYDFITDEKEGLRRYLFESNVRDYLGQVPVNKDISQTLSSPKAGHSEDFWWLNNGITLLA